MQNKRIHSKAKKPSLLEYPPNVEYGENGDIAFVTSPSIGTLLCIKSRNSWWANKFKNLKDLNKNIFEDLQVSGNVEFTTKSNVMFRSGLSTPSDIYLRNSKIYFDMSETTPNDYITGGANDLEFYTSGTKRLDIGVTSSTFSNIIVASDDVKLTSSKKLYFDGGEDTYITSDTDNEINFYLGSGVGGTNRLDLSESAFTGTFQDFSVSSTSSTKPEFVLKNTTSDATGPYIKLLSQRGVTAVDAQDDDYLGYIEFNGYDDGTPSTQTYSTISSKIVDASSGSEEGALYLKAAANNGTLASGISLIGSSSALRADTTIHGKLTINSISSGDGSSENFLVEDSGEVQKRTAAELLTDVGIVFGISDTNVTKCGAGIVDDDFIRVNGTTFEGRSASEVRSDIGAGTSSVAALNDLSDVTYSSGDLTISSLDTIVASGTLTLKLGDGDQGAFNLFSDDASASQASHLFGMELGNYSSIRLNERGGSSNSDYFDINVIEHGATTITTNDSAAAAANLTLDVDGDITLDAVCGNGTGIFLKNEGTTYGKFDIHHSATYFTLYENGGASTSDYMSLYVKEHGETYLLTTDAASSSANFVCHIDGDIMLNPYGGGDIKIYNDAGYNNVLQSFKGSSHYLAEQADALVDSAGFGQIWIHDDNPNTLWFTNDNGDDIQITNGTKIANKSFIVTDMGRYQMSAADDHYSGYINYPFRSTDLTGAISQGGTDTSMYAWYQRFVYTIPVAATVTDIVCTCEQSYTPGQSAAITVWIWKVAAQTNQASTTAATTIDLIGSVVFEDPSDSYYVHAAESPSSLDGTAKVLAANEAILITVSKASGTDSTYAYVKTSIRFEES